MVNETFLKYAPDVTRGVISSANCVWLDDECVLAAALGCAQVLNVRQDTVVSGIDDESHAVITRIVRHNTKPLAAAGYSDGHVRIIDISDISSISTLHSFRAHLTRIESLQFDIDGTQLAVGGADTTISVFDMASDVLRCTLAAHTQPVTALEFVSPHLLVSGSRDKLIKVWDLDSQTSIQTLAGHRGPILSLCRDQWAPRLFSVAGDEHGVTVWQIEPSETEVLRSLGQVARPTHDDPVELSLHPSYPLLLLATRHSVEGFVLGSQHAIEKRQKRRQKRAAEKGGEADLALGAADYLLTPAVLLRVPSATILGVSGRPDKRGRSSASGLVRISAADEGAEIEDEEEEIRRRIQWGSKTVQLGLPTNANSVLVTEYLVGDAFSDGTSRELLRLQRGGHRALVRAVDLSDDERTLVTLSAGMLKSWSAATLEPLPSLGGLNGAVCVRFLPRGQYAVIGCKDGLLLLVRVPTMELIQSVTAHTDAVLDVAVSRSVTATGGIVVATAGADHRVRFWGLTTVEDPEFDGAPATSLRGGRRGRLQLVPERALELTDAVTALAFSPPRGAAVAVEAGRVTERNTIGADPQYVAMALADNTVRVHHFDTLSFHMNLYGHSLPVSRVVFSNDGALIATASGDRSIRVWGTDFADCHHAFRQHKGAVTDVVFIPNTHLLLSVARDGTLRFWDADKFRLLQTIQAHTSDALALAADFDGTAVFTVGQDRQVRRFRQTDEQLFDVDEESLRTERTIEQELVARGHRGAAGELRTVQSQAAAERLQEALLTLRHEDERHREWEAQSEETKRNHPFAPSPLLLGASEYWVFFLRVLRDQIRTPDLPDALAQLSFDEACQAMDLLVDALFAGSDVEFAARWLTLLLKMHFNGLTGNGERFRDRGSAVARSLDQALQRQRDLYGQNLAALDWMASQAEKVQARWVNV